MNQYFEIANDNAFPNDSSLFISLLDLFITKVAIRTKSFESLHHIIQIFSLTNNI